SDGSKRDGGWAGLRHSCEPVPSLRDRPGDARVPGLVAPLLSGSVGAHERALGGWQAELATIQELVEAAGGALDAIERIAHGLVVNAERMKANLEALGGLVFSERLARVMARETDRASAQALVAAWS